MKAFILSVFMVIICRYGGTDYQEKMHLGVFYESKCPDSVNFITEQLLPTMYELHDYLDLTLVPFGKAYSIDNAGRFQCQHGAAECRGNRLQDCALHAMEGAALLQVAYVACEMERFAATRGSYECVTAAGVPAAQVDSCVRSEEGTRLQLISEYATKRLKPRFIPTVTVNGVFDQHIQDNALDNLKGTLCEMIPHAPPCTAGTHRP